MNTVAYPRAAKVCAFQRQFQWFWKLTCGPPCTMNAIGYFLSFGEARRVDDVAVHGLVVPARES